MIKKYSNIQRAEALKLLLSDRANLNLKSNFVNMNFGLITLVMKSYKFNCEHNDDVFNEGVFGLYSAIDSYDQTKGKFSTYATFKIRDRIVKYLSRNEKFLKGGTFAEVWGRLSLSRSNMKSLNDRVSNYNSEDSSEYGDTIISMIESPYDILDSKISTADFYKKISAVIKDIGDDRIIKILECRIFKNTTDSYHNIGQKLNVSGETVRNIYCNFLNKLRESLK